MTYNEKEVRATLRLLHSFLRTLLRCHVDGVAPDFYRSSVRPQNENLGPCAGVSSLRLACSVWSAPWFLECQPQRGMPSTRALLPLTTRSPAARAPRFRFVILTVSSALPGAGPFFYLIYCLALGSYCSSRSLTSVPEAKEEEQEQKVVLSWPSSSATTTVVVANGDPPFRKVMGLAVRSKVVCHCCGADRFTTSAPLSNIAGLASICRI
ncbi:hypothetical protein IEQ34_024708 [Dendrobium chrysotoxum]|uniref:Uncharacterized protein n=1 Tax=Dendrobium chrysotoxum TaxID=161865 RepID=A0AAV7FSS8_DENCH|nr:hypothetical protein IEQ34_024708 [Dendrobium chrysotoxum]